LAVRGLNIRLAVEKGKQRIDGGCYSFLVFAILPFRHFAVESV
jgi:hypothetical protein